MFGERPRVTPQVFQRQVRPALMDHGFTEHQINQVETVFHESLASNPDIPSWKPGIDANTLDQTMQYMRAHPSATAVGPEHWNTVEEILRSHIQ